MGEQLKSLMRGKEKEKRISSMKRGKSVSQKLAKLIKEAQEI